MNLNPFLSHFFLNIHISVDIHVSHLKSSVVVLMVLIQGTMSQIFNLGLSCHFMSKNE